MATPHGRRSVLCALVLVFLASACDSGTSTNLTSPSLTDTPRSAAGSPGHVELILSIKGDPHPLNGPTDVDVDE